MRVVYLAAGAGGMICGSCLRDNRLAATLIRQGRDILLIPLYTPLRTDEENVASQKVLFGGVNAYLQHLSPLFGYLPRFVRGWFDSRYVFDRIADRAGASRPADLGALTVSVLRGEEGRQRAELEGVVDAIRELKPDLINLPNLLLIGLARRLRQAIGVPIVCTLSGEDIFTDAMTEPHRSQARALIRERAAELDGFIALTRYYAGHATRLYGLPADRVRVVPLGVAPIEAAAGLAPRDPSRPFEIGYLARICREKSLHRLVRVFLSLREQGRDCRLHVAGYVGALDREYLASLQREIAQAGAGDRVVMHGEVSHDAKIAMLRSLHAFSVPADYPEAKGLSIIEALSAGVPVVQPAHGSYVEFVNDTGGGVLYRPGDEVALARELTALMDDEPRRLALARAGRDGARTLYSDEAQAQAAWAYYESVARR